MKNLPVKLLALSIIALLGITFGATAQPCYYTITSMSSKHHQKTDGTAGLWLSVDYKAQDASGHNILIVLSIVDDNGHVMKANTTNGRFHNREGSFMMINGIPVGSNLSADHEDFFIPYYVFPDFNGRRDYTFICNFYDKTLGSYIDGADNSRNQLDFHITRSAPQQPAQPSLQPRRSAEAQALPRSAYAAQSYNPLGLQMAFDANRNPFHLNYQFQPPAGSSSGAGSSQSSQVYLLKAGNYKGHSCCLNADGEIDHVFDAYMKVTQNLVTISFLKENNDPMFRIPINLSKAYKATAASYFGNTPGAGYFADTAEIGSPSFRSVSCFKYNGRLYIIVCKGDKQYLFDMSM